MKFKNSLLMAGVLLSLANFAHAEVTFNTKLETLGQNKLDAAKKAAAERGVTYAYEKFQGLRDLLLEFKNGPVKKYLESIDKNKLDEDLQKELEHEFPGQKLGRYDMPLNDVMRYLAVHHQFREIAEKLTEPFHWMLTTSEGPYTATDLLTFYMNPETGNIDGLIIITRKGDGKRAPIGGFTQYFETAVGSGIREAKEEVEIDVPVESTALVGVYDDPNRDPRQHVVSFCYAGITKDKPKETAEAGDIRILSLAEVEAIPDADWFAKDHKQMAIDAFKMFKGDVREKMISGFVAAHPELKDKVSAVTAAVEVPRGRRGVRSSERKSAGRSSKSSSRSSRTGKTRRGR